MAEATVKTETVTTMTVTLTLTEDEAHAVLALTGSCGPKDGDAPTSDVYEALTKALSNGSFYYPSKYSVVNGEGKYPGSLRVI